MLKNNKFNNIINIINNNKNQHNKYRINYSLLQIK